ncbi:hypothetical protein [Catenulispora subtropica]|uniref:hypothetical protein n=1 Tax=Catenulispora subtropica TaxID=450798 RepID=UPI0031E0C7CF
MFHHRWKRVDGKLIDTRIIRVGRPGAPHMHECVVEFTNAAGRAVRLKVIQTNVVQLPAMRGTVPLLVKPDDSKAVFDKRDPRINTNALAKTRKKAEKERFERELRD